MIFRRQYLISNYALEVFPHWRTLKSDNVYFYLHPDLEFAQAKEQEVEITLLGFVISYQTPQKSNEQILQDLAKKTTLKEFIEASNHIGGRYILYYTNAEGSYLITDALSTRKAYYYFDKETDKFFIASQTKLMAKFVGLEKQDDPLFLSFVNGEPYYEMKNFMVGDASYYKEVKQLMPNHFLDIKNKKNNRFFPNVPLPTVYKNKLGETADYLNKILRGFLEALLLRYEVNIPFTAGADSRAQVSVSKDFKDKIHYYINQYPFMSDTDPDIWVPKKLSATLGIPFTIYPVEAVEASEDFEKAYQDSFDAPIQQYKNSHYLQAQHFEDKLVLHTVGSETAKRTTTLGIEKRPLKPIGLNILTYYDPFEPYPLQEAYNWYDKNKHLENLENISLCELYSWENIEANFTGGAMIQGDLYCETCSIFNCREFITKMWAVPFSYRQPIHKFSLKMIKNAWAEALALPINPPSSFKGYIKSLFVRWGIYGYFRANKYRIAERELARRGKQVKK